MRQKADVSSDSKEQIFVFRYKTNRLIFRLFSLCLLFVCLSCIKDKTSTSRVANLPYYSEASFTPRWLSDKKTLLDTLHTIPAFSLINQNSEVITEKTFENKIYVTDFFFTFCPGICPKMTENMKLVQEAFKDDSSVLLVSHSVTPEHDTPEILKEYAIEKGIIDGKWHLVTGERDVIYNLGRHEYFVEEDLGLTKKNDEFLHTENFVLVDQNRHIRGIYNGLNKTSVKQLIVDIKTLQKSL